MTSISVTLRDKTAKGLNAIAERLDRSRSWVVNDAVQAYIEHQVWMDMETQVAVSAVDSGEALIPHDEVMQRMEQRLANLAKESRK